MKKMFGLALVLSLLAAAQSSAALVVGQAQVNLGDVLPAPVIAVNNDLLQTSLSSVTGEGGGNVRNGSTGTAGESSVTNPAVIWGQTTTTYNLNLAGAPLGYSITGVNVFSGWNDDRADQSYRLFYSLVGSAAFTQLGGDIVAGPAGNVQGATLTQTFDTTGNAFLTGVDAIQFVQFDGPTPLDGPGSVYREFDVLGRATSLTELPEPASIAVWSLVGLAGAAAAWRSRRRT